MEIMKQACAFPRKRFFQEMFVRDISLEDCILDLIDNSVDGLLRSRNIHLSSLVVSTCDAFLMNKQLPAINIHYDGSRFSIDDKCGGIPFKHALEEVFSFGHGVDFKGGQLGVYGIGLKRAIFKLGKFLNMESRSIDKGFSVQLDIDKWIENDDGIRDWTIPICEKPSIRTIRDGYTRIVITRLNPEVINRMNDPTFATLLQNRIAETYAYMLGRCVNIFVNGLKVEPKEIPIGESEEITAGHDEFSIEGTKVSLFAGLAARGAKGEWSLDRAGWYVFCNGRNVVFADKSDLTGWGFGGIPSYVSKYRGFVGLAFFESSDPSILPWTTTKRGLNRESSVYQQTLVRMRLLCRPIIDFLNNMYPNEIPDAPNERALAEAIKTARVHELAQKKVSQFAIKSQKKRNMGNTVSIQYSADKDDVERIRKRLRQPSMPANKVGFETFNYYLKNECPK
jgi:hypothetical protein